MNITKAFCLSIALFGASNMQAITNSDFVIQQDNTITIFLHAPKAITNPFRLIISRDQGYQWIRLFKDLVRGNIDLFQCRKVLPAMLLCIRKITPDVSNTAEIPPPIFSVYNDFHG